MADDELLPSQKDWMAQALRAAGFAVSDFTFKANWPGSEPKRATVWAAGERRLPIVRYRDTEYFFVTGSGYSDQSEYGPVEGCWKVWFSPGAEQRLQEQVMDDWSGVQLLFGGWLNNLQRELGATDWWADGGVASPGSSVPKTPFTPDEQDTIRQRLDDIEEQLVREHGANEEYQQFIRQELADIKAMLKTADRKTFRQAILGYALSIAGSVASNPDMAKGIVRLFSHAVSTHTGGVPLLPRLDLA